MDNGGYTFIYNDGKYQILDERDYYPVNLNYKQIAAFKEKNAAFDYVEYLRSL